MLGQDATILCYKEWNWRLDGDSSAIKQEWRPCSKEISSKNKAESDWKGTLLFLYVSFAWDYNVIFDYGLNCQKPVVSKNQSSKGNTQKDALNPDQVVVCKEKHY